MGQVSRIEPRQSRVTRWSAPLLDEKLSGLLASFRGFRDAPVVGPKAATALQQFLDNGNEAPLPSRDDLESMLGLLAAVKRSRNASDAEAEGQLDQYWLGLRDVPLDDLRHAYEALLKSSPWFPDISEIREAAQSGPVAKHRRRRIIAQAIISKHKAEWRPPVEPISPEQFAQVKALLAQSNEGHGG